MHYVYRPIYIERDPLYTCIHIYKVVVMVAPSNHIVTAATTHPGISWKMLSNCAINCSENFTDFAGNCAGFADNCVGFAGNFAKKIPKIS